MTKGISVHKKFTLLAKVTFVVTKVISVEKTLFGKEKSKMSTKFNFVSNLIF